MTDTALEYPFASMPVPGDAMAVAPGIHWLRMPLPFALDHVNLWLIEEEDGWTVVDTGLCNDESKAAWGRVFDRHLAGRPVVRVVVTHFHPDHVGLAGWLCDRFGAELCMTRTEWMWARMLRLDAEEEARSDMASFLRLAGCGPDLTWEALYQGGTYTELTGPVPRAYRRLSAGMTVRLGGRDWTVITGAGHAPEHACLHCPELGVLIAGDQVLPRITPNIGIHATEVDDDPLGDYLSSIETLRALAAGTLVLPSHNEPFRGLHRRLDALSAHHHERLELLRGACVTPKTVAELTEVMFRRPLFGFNLYLATAETMAHLNLLLHRHELERQVGADGSFRYRRVGERLPMAS